ncbi:hypothetical protein [Leptospira borgpetersenii]|nr:hypothetical protein [Leptospira borgpetersenii]
MQSFPMGRSAGRKLSLFHGRLCRSSDGFLQVQAIVGDRECYASSSRSDQSSSDHPGAKYFHFLHRPS